jgi:3-oxoacyl-[acyl-carrier protein] reductase
MDSHFAQRVAVVTGGSSGIGEAIARSLIHAGARAAVLDLKENPAILPSLFIHCDVRDSGSVRAAFQEVSERLGPVEFLVSTAGVVSEAFLEEMDEKEWDRVVETSLKGTFLCCQAA